MLISVYGIKTQSRILVCFSSLWCSETISNRWDSPFHWYCSLSLLLMSAICTNVTRGDLSIIYYNGVSFNKILEKYMAIILGIECSQTPWTCYYREMCVLQGMGTCSRLKFQKWAIKLAIPKIWHHHSKTNVYIPKGLLCFLDFINIQGQFSSLFN